MKRRLIVLALFALVITGFVAITAQAQTTTQWALSDLIQFVAQDINNMWAAEFAERNIQYRPPSFIRGYVQRTRSACGNVRTQTALYCAASNGIYYEVNFMNTALTRIGDFAVAAVIAHEWAHSIQFQLGTLSPSNSIENELQADCLAGAYAKYADTVSNVLEAGDFEEGRQLFSMIGDPAGLDASDENAHGTAAQRVASYEQGFAQGIDGCIG